MRIGLPLRLNSSAQRVTLWLAPQLSILTPCARARVRVALTALRRSRTARGVRSRRSVEAAAYVESSRDDEVDILLVVRLPDAVLPHGRISALHAYAVVEV